MTSYLVDTNIVSAGAPGRHERSATVVTWMEANSAGLFLSVVSIAELHSGIARLRREGASRKAVVLSDWLAAVEYLYQPRILPIDMKIAAIAGALSDRARAQGAAPGLADVFIAATAQVHQLVVLTRNLRHFRPLGAEAMDPFQPDFSTQSQQ